MLLLVEYANYISNPDSKQVDGYACRIRQLRFEPW